MFYRYVFIVWVVLHGDRYFIKAISFIQNKNKALGVSLT